jgi:hypothetical protein
MSALWWLLIPTIATGIAIGYVIWAGREKGPADAHQTMAKYAKFQEAMERNRRKRGG